MNLAQVTLLSALAGQDLVPEQALQVQEADEAGRGSSGGERAGQWPGAVWRLPAGAAWLEPQLLIRKGLRWQRGLLHPQLHVVVPLGAPRSYAATPTNVRLPTRSACLLPVSLGPGPSRLPVHPPNSCALDPKKGPEGKKGTVKAGRQPPPQSPWLSGLVTSLAPTPLPEPDLGRAVTAERGPAAQTWPRETAGAAR